MQNIKLNAIYLIEPFCYWTESDYGKGWFRGRTKHKLDNTPNNLNRYTYIYIMFKVVFRLLGGLILFKIHHNKTSFLKKSKKRKVIHIQP